MKLNTVFLVLAIVGAVVPWIFFIDFFRTAGPGADFIGALFANGAAGGFSADLLVSSFVFWLFAFAEARRTGMSSPWLYVVLNLLIGLSCALPLFLWSRSRRLERAGYPVARNSGLSGAAV